MNTQTPFTEIAGLEKELSEIAPLVRQGFRLAGGPSARVDAAVHAEIRRQAKRQKGRAARRLWGKLAAAAAAVLMLGGSVELFVSQHRTSTAHQRSAVVTAPAAAAADSASGFAGVLLEIQGLDEDGFFRPEEVEPLWL